MKFFLLAIIFLISFLNNFAFGEIPQSNKIIAYYSFSGNANDSSGNDYNGTISGNPQLTTDRFGNSNSAYSFDGNGDWIYFGTDTLPTNNGGNISDAYTISVWAKSSSNSTMDLFAYGGMVSCGGGRYGAIVRLGSNIQFNSCNNGFNTSASGKNSDGNWHQYVVTWNGSNSRKVYIDGSLVSSNSTSNVFRIQDTGLVIGRGFMDWTLGTTFNGSADEMRLWNTELSSSEVQTLYDDESTSAPTLSSSVPTDNATSIAVDSTIVLNFSESVDAESGNITIKKTSDNSTVETIDVTSGQVTGSGTSQITINPLSNFDAETEYYVLIDAAAFDDSDSGSYAGISSTTALSFTVDALSDPTTDKDVVGSIEAQTEAPKRILQYVTTPVINRMEWLRHHRKETNLTNQSIKFQFSNAMLASLSNVIPASIDINENLDLFDNWSYWSEGSISVGKIGDTSSSSSKDIDSNGITIGMDKKIDENKMYGYALRFGRDEVEVGTSGTSLNTNYYSLSIYGTVPHEDTKFLDTLLGVSSLKTDHIRKNGSNTLTGERSGRQVFGSINFSTKYNKEKFNITPNARIDLGYTELSNYSEIGTDALTYDKQKIETGMVSIGLRLDDIIQFKSITFKPNGLLEYGSNFSPSSNATVSYVSDPNTDYTLSIAHEATHNIRAGLGFELIKENGLTIIANYERDQSDNAHSDTLYLGASYISNRDTEYAMKIDGSEDLKAGFDITKNVNGFDLSFNANQAFNETSDQTANVSLSRSF